MRLGISNTCGVKLNGQKVLEKLMRNLTWEVMCVIGLPIRSHPFDLTPQINHVR